MDAEFADATFANASIIGAQFIKYCDEQCKSEDIQVIYHHIKAAHDFGPLLINSGYELVDLIYAKRLD